ncbi:MAG: class I SAM-dependent methyltransferase [Myxococcota bacterium]
MATRPTKSCCLFCKSDLNHVFVDLGMSPLCESFLPEEDLNRMEPFYPLVVYVCSNCWLVQLEKYVSPEEIFTEYAYFSSFSDSWVAHGLRYTEMIVDRLGLTVDSHVVEVASNDGYLLQHFVKKGIPVLGIEPAANVAKAAEEKNVPSLVEFFGRECATKLVQEGKAADLIIGNNVLAQVHDINDFVAGMKILLKEDGVVTVEFPHLLRLMAENQFDTIYHEHFSYFSFLSATAIFKAHGMRLFDVDELPTHGGSLRIYACHEDNTSKPNTDRAKELLAREEAEGFRDLARYGAFQERVDDTKGALLEFLVQARREGKTVAGYGAPGKGNTLLNYCGIRTDLIEYTVDRNPYKHGRFTPGTHIPIYPPERIAETKPDYLFILPWNLKDEIIKQNEFIREWGGQFVIPIPEVHVVP